MSGHSSTTTLSSAGTDSPPRRTTARQALLDWGRRARDDRARELMDEQSARDREFMRALELRTGSPGADSSSPERSPTRRSSSSLTGGDFLRQAVLSPRTAVRMARQGGKKAGKMLKESVNRPTVLRSPPSQRAWRRSGEENDPSQDNRPSTLHQAALSLGGAGRLGGVQTFFEEVDELVARNPRALPSGSLSDADFKSPGQHVRDLEHGPGNVVVQGGVETAQAMRASTPLASRTGYQNYIINSQGRDRPHWELSRQILSPLSGSKDPLAIYGMGWKDGFDGERSPEQIVHDLYEGTSGQSPTKHNTSLSPDTDTADHHDAKMAASGTQSASEQNEDLRSHPSVEVQDVPDSDRDGLFLLGQDPSVVPTPRFNIDDEKYGSVGASGEEDGTASSGHSKRVSVRGFDVMMSASRLRHGSQPALPRGLLSEDDDPHSSLDQRRSSDNEWMPVLEEGVDSPEVVAANRGSSAEQKHSRSSSKPRSKDADTEAPATDTLELFPRRLARQTSEANQRFALFKAVCDHVLGRVFEQTVSAGDSGMETPPSRPTSGLPSSSGADLDSKQPSVTSQQHRLRDGVGGTFISTLQALFVWALQIHLYPVEELKREVAKHFETEAPNVLLQNSLNDADPSFTRPPPPPQGPVAPDDEISRVHDQMLSTPGFVLQAGGAMGWATGAQTDSFLTDRDQDGASRDLDWSPSITVVMCVTYLLNTLFGTDWGVNVLGGGDKNDGGAGSQSSTAQLPPNLVCAQFSPDHARMLLHCVNSLYNAVYDRTFTDVGFAPTPYFTRLRSLRQSYRSIAKGAQDVQKQLDFTLASLRLVLRYFHRKLRQLLFRCWRQVVMSEKRQEKTFHMVTGKLDRDSNKKSEREVHRIGTIFLLWRAWAQNHRLSRICQHELLKMERLFSLCYGELESEDCSNENLAEHVRRLLEVLSESHAAQGAAPLCVSVQHGVPFFSGLISRCRGDILQLKQFELGRLPLFALAPVGCVPFHLLYGHNSGMSPAELYGARGGMTRRRRRRNRSRAASEAPEDGSLYQCLYPYADMAGDVTAFYPEHAVMGVGLEVDLAMEFLRNPGAMTAEELREFEVSVAAKRNDAVGALCGDGSIDMKALKPGAEGADGHFLNASSANGSERADTHSGAADISDWFFRAWCYEVGGEWGGQRAGRRSGAFRTNGTSGSRQHNKKPGTQGQSRPPDYVTNSVLNRWVWRQRESIFQHIDKLSEREARVEDQLFANLFRETDISGQVEAPIGVAEADNAKPQGGNASPTQPSALRSQTEVSMPSLAAVETFLVRWVNWCLLQHAGVWRGEHPALTDQFDDEESKELRHRTQEPLDARTRLPENPPSVRLLRDVSTDLRDSELYSRMIQYLLRMQVTREAEMAALAHGAGRQFRLGDDIGGTLAPVGPSFLQLSERTAMTSNEGATGSPQAGSPTNGLHGGPSTASLRMTLSSPRRVDGSVASPASNLGGDRDPTKHVQRALKDSASVLELVDYYARAREVLRLGGYVIHGTQGWQNSGWNALATQARDEDGSGVSGGLMCDTELVEGIPDVHLVYLGHMFLGAQGGVSSVPGLRWFERMDRVVTMLERKFNSIVAAETVSSQSAYGFLLLLHYTCLQISVQRTRLLRRERHCRQIFRYVQQFVQVLQSSRASGVADDIYQARHVINRMYNYVSVATVRQLMGVLLLNETFGESDHKTAGDDEEKTEDDQSLEDIPPDLHADVLRNPRLRVVLRDSGPSVTRSVVKIQRVLAQYRTDIQKIQAFYAKETQRMVDDNKQWYLSVYYTLDAYKKMPGLAEPLCLHHSAGTWSFVSFLQFCVDAELAAPSVITEHQQEVARSSDRRGTNVRDVRGDLLDAAKQAGYLAGSDQKSHALLSYPELRRLFVRSATATAGIGEDRGDIDLRPPIDQVLDASPVAVGKLYLSAVGLMDALLRCGSALFADSIEDPGECMETLLCERVMHAACRSAADEFRLKLGHSRVRQVFKGYNKRLTGLFSRYAASQNEMKERREKEAQEQELEENQHALMEDARGTVKKKPSVFSPEAVQQLYTTYNYNGVRPSESPAFFNQCVHLSGLEASPGLSHRFYLSRYSRYRQRDAEKRRRQNSEPPKGDATDAQERKTGSGLFVNVDMPLDDQEAREAVGGSAQVMDVGDFRRMCSDLDLPLPAYVFEHIFDSVQQDEDFGQYEEEAGLELSYQEFLEALAAIAVFLEPDPFMPLYQKVERFIDALVGQQQQVLGGRS